MLTAQSLTATGDSRFPDRNPVPFLKVPGMKVGWSLAKRIMYQALEQHLQ